MKPGELIGESTVSCFEAICVFGFVDSRQLWQPAVLPDHRICNLGNPYY